MQSLINISIDDISPHPRSSTRVLDRCFEMINVFPEIKFSLFVPVAYWRTRKPGTATRQPIFINDQIHVQFCEELRSLPDKNFEICYHGYHHGIPGISDNDEFKNLSYKEAFDLFQKMFKTVSSAGLEKKFKKIFRPPAWRMSPDSIIAAKDCGVEILALSEWPYAIDSYGGQDKVFGNVVYEKCCPPHKDLKLYEKTEIVYHACEWDKNYLSKELSKELELFLKSCDDFSFCFLEEMIK